ncbi:cupin domain-containing protein [Cytophagales bacterium LB-30]|uniref:Cupin domain-containing protein n=1 Tax=Shiella aurantiaca TaxID=3058365 RepID=A0ABT8F5E0_9BACT|nr:cupin domain-containing protein [Shiella aurantiaca]MDN4165682.1 cupin domain-containing protein [Shiella aurantiaca]
MLRFILFFGLLWASSLDSLAQQFQNLGRVQAPANFENIHVQPLFQDSLSSGFVIFIKKEVKLHLHEHHTESVYILEGYGEMIVENTLLNVKAGDYIFLPKNTPHAVYVKSEIPLKVLSIQSPRFDGSDRIWLD